MTGKERFTKILAHEKADRIGLYEHFWIDTDRAWRADPNCPLKKDQAISDYFGYDVTEGGWAINWAIDLDKEPEVVAEDEDTITIKDGNYATLRRHKKHDSTPEHIGFEIDSYDKWKEIAKPRLMNRADFARRVNIDAYRAQKKAAEERGQFFTLGDCNVFEHMHPVCGHVNMLMAMLDDPDWVADMCETYSYLLVEFQKILFEAAGYPDGMWYYEDMGYKGAPFMSPDMYREFIFPAHKYTIDYAKSHGVKTIMHSCGFVEPLLPGMIEAGIDALQVIEIKAGMDLERIFRTYGDKIALIGGIDVRKLYTNDRKQIDEELEAKIPMVKEGYAYVLHSDHSIPATVNFDTYEYFVKRGLELGTY